jgi:uroporphyrin-III C-methyltransferase/precorrin-2 dehydrogenase/sirohydrochlorin ferrochelatase
VTAPLLPLFVKLAGRDVLVVGGGAMASLRVAQLAAAGARVTVVAPAVREDVALRAAAVVRRAFRPSDLDGAWLAVAAASPEVNREVARAAEARRILVNAVDDPEAATAYTGGVVRRGGATVAISTDGRAPALAALLREAIDALLPRELDRWVAAAEARRPAWKAERVPLAARRPLLLREQNAHYPAEPAEPAAGEAPTWCSTTRSSSPRRSASRRAPTASGSASARGARASRSAPSSGSSSARPAPASASCA